MTPQPLVNSLRERILEEASLTQALLARIPPECAQWRLPWPPEAGAPAQSLQELAWHLAETMSGFCAALAPLHPDRMALVPRLPQPPGPVEEARRWFGIYLEPASEGLSLVPDAELARLVSTLFHPEGQTVLALLLANLSHLVNHKHQLFLCLKTLGQPLTTRDLYRFVD